jgi:ABC-type transporter Mla subunit MlaD
MKEIRDSLRKLEELAPQVKQTLQDFSLLAKRSSDLIPELQKTNDDARMFLKTSTRWIEDIGVTFRADEPKLIAAVQSFQQTSDQFRKLVSDDNQKQITRIVNNVAQASDRFDNIAKDTEILTKDAKKCLDQLIADVKEGLKPIQQAFNDVGEIIADVKKISRTVSDRIDKIAQNLEIGSDQFARTLMDVRDILRTFSKAEGTLMKFINDPSFYLNLNETAVGVQKILPRFDRILKDLEVFADKIARHPEALGIGGAVRPDSGLKEAPTVPGPVFRPRQ